MHINSGLSNRPFARSGHMVQNKLCWTQKEKSDWSGKSSFVLEVPLCYLRSSIIFSVPCDRILQRAYHYQLFGMETTTKLVSFAAVIWVVTQLSSPLTVARSREDRCVTTLITAAKETTTKQDLFYCKIYHFIVLDAWLH